MEDCKDLNTCYGNNPDSPYGLPMLPRGVGENTDFDEWGKPLEVEGMSPTWRLQPNDAVVIFGDSPPEMRYWGITNYIFSKHYNDTVGKNTTVSPVSQCPQPPARCEIFADLGDT